MASKGIQGAFLHHKDYCILPVLKYSSVCTLTPTRGTFYDGELNIGHYFVEIDRLINDDGCREGVNSIEYDNMFYVFFEKQITSAFGVRVIIEADSLLVVEVAVYHRGLQQILRQSTSN